VADDVSGQYKHGEIRGVPLSLEDANKIHDIFGKHFLKDNALEFAGVSKGKS
jgi:hypothetical protein